MNKETPKNLKIKRDNIIRRLVVDNALSLEEVAILIEPTVVIEEKHIVKEVIKEVADPIFVEPLGEEPIIRNVDDFFEFFNNATNAFVSEIDEDGNKIYYDALYHNYCTMYNIPLNTPIDFIDKEHYKNFLKEQENKPKIDFSKTIKV